MSTPPVPGVTVVSLHYTADPAKADPRWRDDARAGYPPDKWEREMEMNVHAGARTAIFGKRYRPDKHERPLTPDSALPMRLAFDFGEGWPACVWFQRTRLLGLRVLASMHGEHIQLRPFLERVLAFELTTWGDIFQARRVYCDPAGNQPKDDGMKSVEVLREFGWSPRWRGSRVEEGIEEIDRLMREDQDDGEPRYLIDPRFNVLLIEAHRSAYRRDVQGKPERGHPHVDLEDAHRYGVINTKLPERPPQRPPAHYVDPISGYGRAPIPASVTGGFR